MSPEYAMDGILSVKSDVFSFGVLVLEIISGKKNRGVYLSNPEVNLLGLVSIPVIMRICMCQNSSDWNQIPFICFSKL